MLELLKTEDIIGIITKEYIKNELEMNIYGIPAKDTLLGLALGNCEVAKYVYKEKEIDER